MALTKRQKSLKSWTKQKWRTKSGKPSTQGPKANEKQQSKANNLPSNQKRLQRKLENIGESNAIHIQAEKDSSCSYT